MHSIHLCLAVEPAFFQMAESICQLRGVLFTYSFFYQFYSILRKITHLCHAISVARIRFCTIWEYLFHGAQDINRLGIETYIQIKPIAIIICINFSYVTQKIVPTKSTVNPGPFMSTQHRRRKTGGGSQGGQAPPTIWEGGANIPFAPPPPPPPPPQ